MLPVTNEFRSSTSSTALQDAIVDRIRTGGGITFRDYMAMALYHPGLGYYTSRRDKIGRSGDYFTSPETSRVFGVLIGRQLREMWEVIGRPAEFTVVEVGAGTGALSRDILGWALSHAPDFADALLYVIVEISAALAERQRETLESEGFTGRVSWRDDLPGGSTGCILSNELLDAMPVHRVRTVDGHLHEAYVVWDGARLFEELRHLSTPEIARYFQRLGLTPGEGCYAEVNLEAAALIRRSAAALDRGFIMTFDYGYEAAELYAPWRTDGTLLCFYSHNPSHDPYARIGRQDITSHVDFTTVRRAGEEAGLATLGLVTQAEFLTNLGAAEALSAPTGHDLEEYFARRREVMELIDPAGLGRIKVLIQSRAAGDARLAGVHGGSV